MGYIQLHDGVSSRRIPVSELSVPIHVDVTGDDGPRVVVPKGIEVAHGDDDLDAALRAVDSA